jgi:UDP-N-acetylmuramoylalanine--D-glutamate ligase
MEFRGKKILVLGAGISGLAVAQLLQQIGAQVTLSDSKSGETINQDVSKLQQAGVRLALGCQDETLLFGVDLVVVSPGISINIPLIKAAEGKAIKVVSEIEVAYHLCRASIIAITGTNGKTTTTTLLGEMLKTTGRDVVVGGNIGQALSQEVAGVADTGIVVAEISSFQLEGVKEFHPHIVAILNITPDHLDRHGSMEGYIAMKERIFANQTDSDYAILNYDDSTVRNMAAKVASKVMFFSRLAKLPEGIFVQAGMIKICWQGNTVDVCCIDDMQIRGSHNVENALAACGAAFLAGVKVADMATTLQKFAGVEHRIEPVATIRQVAYYNDSKATNPESAIKALEAFPGHIILIAGGRDKNTNLEEFISLVKERVDHLILLGEAQERFGAMAKQYGVCNIHYVDSLQAAVQLAHRIAQVPQVVLLSPACASYDMFANYEERGKRFKELVNELN